MSRGVWESVHGGSRKWFPDHLASGLVDTAQNAGHRRSRGDRSAPLRSDHPPAGRRRAGKEMAPALLALVITTAYLAVALTS